MKGVIIAAGQGTRLRAKIEVKPLIPLLGVPLIERVIRSALEGGADEIYVVTGYREEQVANFLKQLAKRLNITSKGSPFSPRSTICQPSKRAISSWEIAGSTFGGRVKYFFESGSLPSTFPRRTAIMPFGLTVTEI